MNRESDAADEGCAAGGAFDSVSSSFDSDRVDAAPVAKVPPLLQPVLAMCELPILSGGTTFRHGLVEFFERCDNRAISAQRRHRKFVGIAAFCGAFAVVVAIFQLRWFHVPMPSDPPSLPAWLEILTAVSAVVAVALGLWAALAHRWLQDRFKAEACRVAIYNLLLNAGELRDGGRSKPIETFVQELDAMTNRRIPHLWVRRELPFLQWGRIDADKIDDEYVFQLRDYYVGNRIREQYDYFEREGNVRGFWERLTVHIPGALFFISVGAACVHFGLEIALWLAAEDNQFLPNLLEMRIFLMIAACAPVIGAGVRTYRSAHEFGRNTNRYISMVNHLKTLRSQLTDASKSARELLALMWETERALESEHRSWMRLMIEAEWFG